MMLVSLLPSLLRSWKVSSHSVPCSTRAHSRCSINRCEKEPVVWLTCGPFPYRMVSKAQGARKSVALVPDLQM